jgi:hypothetical protein
MNAKAPDALGKVSAAITGAAGAHALLKLAPGVDEDRRCHVTPSLFEEQQRAGLSVTLLR